MAVSSLGFSENEQFYRLRPLLLDWFFTHKAQFTMDFRSWVLALNLINFNKYCKQKLLFIVLFRKYKLKFLYFNMYAVVMPKSAWQDIQNFFLIVFWFKINFPFLY